MRIVLTILLVSISLPASAEILLPSLILQAPGATRSIGMGFTGVADDSDPSNAFHNPANLHGTEGLWIHGGYGNWDGDLNRFDFGIAGGSQAVGGDERWSLSAGLWHGRADLREFTGSRNVKLADHESWMTGTIATGFGGDVVRLGVGGSYRWSTDEGDNESMFDAGVVMRGAIIDSQARLRIRYSIGWSLRNIGVEGVQPAAGELEPRSIEEQRIGISMRFEAGVSEEERRPAKFGIGANIESNTDLEGGGVGVEATLFDLADLRAGYRDSLFGNEHARTVGTALHHWFDFFYIRLDYALTKTTQREGNLHSFGTLLGFDF